MRVPIPYSTYQRLIQHLTINASADASAKELLVELQTVHENGNARGKTPNR